MSQVRGSLVLRGFPPSWSEKGLKCPAQNEELVCQSLQNLIMRGKKTDHTPMWASCLWLFITYRLVQNLEAIVASTFGTGSRPFNAGTDFTRAVGLQDTFCHTTRYHRADSDVTQPL